MKQKEVLLVTVTIFLTVVVWVVADLYHISVTQQVTEVDPHFSEPITIEIPVDVFEKLESKTK